MSHRVYNFSAGPAMLPTEVLEQAQAELLDWQGSGMSVMEISHRSPAFMELAKEMEQDFRELLDIPNNYKVLFLSGGAQAQFSMVPLNLLDDKKKANYVCTGFWSKLASVEAARYGEVIISTDAEPYTHIPSLPKWQIDPDAAYLHYVDNETIHGVEFSDVPDITNMFLVADMSSNMLSKPIDVSKFGLIYACAQKNLGQAGLTVVIVREDLLGNAQPFTPKLYNYQTYAAFDSMYNTPATFAWYIAGLGLKWIKKQGGLVEIQKKNIRKSKKIYDFIDNNEFYNNMVEPAYRSNMNVVFNLKDETYNEIFLEQSLKAGLAHLKGHKRVGGMRASIYNAMPEAGVDALIEFMNTFQANYGGVS